MRYKNLSYEELLEACDELLVNSKIITSKYAFSKKINDSFIKENEFLKSEYISLKSVAQTTSRVLQDKN